MQGLELLQGEIMWVVLTKIVWVKLVSLFPASRNYQGFLFQSLENSQYTSLLYSGMLHLMSPNEPVRSLHITWPALHQQRQMAGQR